jgi:ADP-ribose pyrophosphatase YjhB (NUDIX family)
VQARVFCPFCGAPLGPVVGAAQACSGCGRPFYHNAAPCSAVLVEDAGRVLLARRAVDPGKDLWDLPGGFCEPGETPEEGAVRELREETGADIELTGFLGHVVDTYGPEGDATLNCVFRARLVGDPVLEPADDVAELHWFAPAELPGRDQIAFANTAEALRRWRDD